MTTTATSSGSTSKRRALDWRKRYYYDAHAAERPVRFFERNLCHIKGRLAGKPIRLAHWQKKFLRRLFGWRHIETGLRKFRTLFLFIAKKNGKSILAAGLALFLLCADGEAGAEIMCAAADKDQARIVFDMASQLVLKSPTLRRSCRVFKNTIVHLKSGSTYKVISSVADTKHGPDLSGLIVDEVHVQKSKDLIDTLHAGTVARQQPLSIFCSTAGFDQRSVCGKMYDEAKQILDGTLEDDTVLPVIHEGDRNANVLDEENWKRANPNLGVSVTLDYMRARAVRAANDPDYELTFRRLHLNEWTAQAKRWIPMAFWDQEPNRLPLELPELQGKLCYGGLDLGTADDLSAFVLAFPLPESFAVLPFIFVPEETVIERARSVGTASYLSWVSQGQIIATPGKSTNFGFIREKIKELRKIYKLKQIAYDRWEASQIKAELTADNFEMVPMGQGVASMSAPCKEFYIHLSEGRIQHGGHPVLRWMAGNAAKKQDPAGNIKPDKDASGDKIDGLVAMIMALSRCFVSHRKKSVYSERGLRTAG